MLPAMVIMALTLAAAMMLGAPFASARATPSGFESGMGHGLGILTTSMSFNHIVPVSRLTPARMIMSADCKSPHLHRSS
jgi:hypothetical protein